MGGSDVFDVVWCVGVDRMQVVVYMYVAWGRGGRERYRMERGEWLTD